MMALLDVLKHTAGALYVRALKEMPPDVKRALEAASDRETHALAKEFLGTILRNIAVAEETGNIVCQDTGTPVSLLRMGENFPLTPAQIVDTIREGCDRATREHDLRPGAGSYSAGTAAEPCSGLSGQIRYFRQNDP